MRIRIALALMIAGALSVFGQTINGSADARIEKIVEVAAENFASMRCADFIAVAEYENMVRCREHYCQALLSYGLFASFDFRQDKVVNLFDDPAIGYYMPLGSFNSLFRIPGGKEYAGRVSLSEYGVEGIKEFDQTFSQYSLIPPVARMRAVEVYGPLNPRKVKCYSYKMLKESSSGEYEISFSTKTGVFPKMTRLAGSGIIHIKDGVIVGFTLKNVEDRFSHFVGKTLASPMIPVTDYTYETRYSLVDGTLFPDSLVENVRWVAPEDKTKPAYFWAEKNPCIKPFDAGLKSTLKVSFGKYIKLDKVLKARIFQSFKPSGEPWRVTLGEPSVDDRIGKMMRDNPSWAAARKDLEAIGESLTEQNRLQTELYTAPRSDPGSPSPVSHEQIARRLARRDLETKGLFKELYP